MARKRVLRSQAARAVVVGLGAGLLLVLLGVIGHELTPAWFVAGGVVATFLTALVWLAIEPNAPHHPAAAREDRGFNYVRGESGGGG